VVKLSNVEIMAFLAGLTNTLIGKLPGLIENAEPQIEAALRPALEKMRDSNPREASLFLQNWNLLDRVVKSSLAAPVAAGKRKSSKKTRRNKHK
jgi:hypothetical protein